VDRSCSLSRYPVVKGKPGVCCCCQLVDSLVMSGEEGAPGGTKVGSTWLEGVIFFMGHWGSWLGALLEAENFQIQPPTAPEWP